MFHPLPWAGNRNVRISPAFAPKTRGKHFGALGAWPAHSSRYPTKALLLALLSWLALCTRCWLLGDAEMGSPGHVKRNEPLWMCMNCSSLVTVGAFKKICCLFFLKNCFLSSFLLLHFLFHFFFSFFFFLHFFLSETKKKKYLKPVFLTRWPSWWKNFPVLFRHDSPLWTHPSLHDTLTNSCFVNCCQMGRKQHPGCAGCCYECISDWQGNSHMWM